MNPEIEKLLGRRRVTVQPLPVEKPDEVTVLPAPVELVVKQFTLDEYDKALPLLDDERALVAWACGKTKKEISDLTPESYEALQAAVWEVNEKGFFPFARRQIDGVIKNLSSLPPELMQAQMEKMILRARSQTSPPPRR